MRSETFERFQLDHALAKISIPTDQRVIRFAGMDEPLDATRAR